MYLEQVLSIKSGREGFIMKQYPAKQIRNIVLSGHSSSGKTSLVEAMLFLTGATDRHGKIADGNTVCDFDPEEIKRKVSVSACVAPVEWKNVKINIIDTPGLFDFVGSVCEGMRAADSVIIVVSGKSGVNVGTEKAYAAGAQTGKAKAFFVSKLDEENADFYKVFSQLKDTFGPSVCPVVVPHMSGDKVDCYINLIDMKAYSYEENSGKSKEIPLPEMGEVFEDIKLSLYEAVAEADEAMFEKYFSGEPFTKEEIAQALHSGLHKGLLSPVFCGAPHVMGGIDLLLDDIVDIFPSAEEAASETYEENSEIFEIKCDENGPLVAIVFKTVADPFVGRLSYYKVISGKMSSDKVPVNTRTGQTERIGKTLIARGKKQEDVPFVSAGDIGAVAKLVNTNTGDTLCNPSKLVTLEPVMYPKPCLSMAIKSKAKGDEEKISQGLHRLMEEDPTCEFYMNSETHQQILSGLGEQHLDVILSKLKNKFQTTVDIETPKVAYRETIRKKVKVEGKHKKQTGGHGQFGHVWIEFEPCDSQELVFVDKVFGGAVPKNFFPAVEKGLRDSVSHGTLAGYPVVGLKATLVDGSYHPVDSSEMSFKMAAAIAYRNGLPQASPVILEPIASVKVYVPDSNTGDIMGDLNKRRGRVLGMEPCENHIQRIDAEAPMSEMHDFSTAVRSITQGRGSFSLSFERYEDAPPNIAQKVIEDADYKGSSEE
jgi:elongation factor G